MASLWPRVGSVLDQLAIEHLAEVTADQKMYTGLRYIPATGVQNVVNAFKFASMNHKISSMLQTIEESSADVPINPVTTLGVYLVSTILICLPHAP